MLKEAKSVKIVESLHKECGILDDYTIDVLVSSCSCGERIGIPLWKEYTCPYCKQTYN
jgi:hypothetical protein